MKFKGIISIESAKIMFLGTFFKPLLRRRPQNLVFKNIFNLETKKRDSFVQNVAVKNISKMENLRLRRFRNIDVKDVAKVLVSLAILFFSGFIRKIN